MRLLIVEDDPLVSLALEAFLADIGHTIVGAAVNANEVFQIIDGGIDADLAIVDFHLGRGSHGIEVATSIFQRSRAVSVFLTSDIEGARAARHVAVGCLYKPISGKELTSAMIVLEVLLRGGILNEDPQGFELFSRVPWLPDLKTFE